MTDHFAGWKNTNQTRPNSQMEGAEYQEMLRLIRSVLAPLIIEGQDFLIAQQDDDDGALRPFLDDALRSIHTASDQQPLIQRREILAASGIVHGKAVLDRILDVEADKRLGSCLLLTRRFCFNVSLNVWSRRRPTPSIYLLSKLSLIFGAMLSYILLDFMLQEVRFFFSCEA